MVSFMMCFSTMEHHVTLPSLSRTTSMTMYRTKVDNLQVLTGRIRQPVAQISLWMLQNAFREVVVWFQLCRDTDGGHVEST
ncbi:hypothetical protein PR048_027569 [Dryococelus australis]|uniref:Uncharacterized protein n=1 Tax=Dryococelus australis TaxID=614101 RepID=A0ABQ9GGW3_9NEOP|nr:hypothetical protein PR048_027569 [Dryococelus australis]